MRVVLYTHEHFRTDELFLYLYAHVASAYPDTHVVAVRRPVGRATPTLQRGLRKLRRLGWIASLEILSSIPLARRIHRLHGVAIDRGLRGLLRPHVAPTDRVTWTSSVNGPDAVATIRELEPDLLIQAGAGIIKPAIFTAARLGMLNVHHGIAPLLRGMHSTAWALWEHRPECLGATIHRVDEGIDTGDVLAYARVVARPGDGVATLFVRATEAAARELLQVMTRLESGERWKLDTPPGAQVYRSTMSGWRLWLLERRLSRARERSHVAPDC